MKLIRKFLEGFASQVEFLYTPLSPKWIGTSIYEQKKLEKEKIQPFIDSIDNLIHGEETSHQDLSSS